MGVKDALAEKTGNKGEVTLRQTARIVLCVRRQRTKKY